MIYTPINAGIFIIRARIAVWEFVEPCTVTNARILSLSIEADYVLLNEAEFRTSSGSIIYQEALGSENAEKIMDELSATGMDFEKFWSRKPKILKFL